MAKKEKVKKYQDYATYLLTIFLSNKFPLPLP